MKKISKSILYGFLTFLLCIVAFTIMSGLPNSSFGLKYASQILFFLYVGLYCLLSWYLGEWFSYYQFFLLSFFIFQCGGYILYGFDIKYDLFYINSFTIVQNKTVLLYSSLCVGATFFAGIFSKTAKKDFYFTKKIKKIPFQNIEIISKWILICTSVVAIPYNIIKMYINLTIGYTAVNNFQMDLNPLFGIIIRLFTPSLLLFLTYNFKDKMKRNIGLILLLVYSGIQTMTGDRSSGIAGILVVGILIINGKEKKKKDIRKLRINKKNIKKYVLFVLILIVSIYLVPLAFNIRIGDAMYETNGNLFEMFFTLISSIGGSYLPLLLIVGIYPIKNGYLYGLCTLTDFASGFIISSLDVFNLIGFLDRYRLEPLNLIDKYSNYNFGVDFSMMAETYVDLGMQGWLLVVVICVFIAHFLRKSSNDNIFNKYIAVSLLYSWFTLPRRQIYYVSNSFIYNVVLMYLIIVIINYFVFKRNHQLEVT